MADTAKVMSEISLTHLPQHAAALRTRKLDPGFLLASFPHFPADNLELWGPNKAGEFGPNLGSGQDKVHLGVLDGFQRHGSCKGVFGILHDRESTVLLDEVQPEAAVVQVSAQHHSNH